MSDIKQIVEMVRKVEPNPEDAQIKTYANPKWDQYRSQQERLANNKRLLSHHFSDINEWKSAIGAINDIHSAFELFDDKNAKEHHNRVTNVVGFLADVIASGVEYGRSITNAKLPPEELKKVKAIGKDRAIKLAMHAFAHGLLPRVAGIDPGSIHHLRTDQNSLRNHEFISSTLTKGLLPPDVLNLKEEKVLGSEIVGDAYSFLKQKHAEAKSFFDTISNRADEVRKARGFNHYYDSLLDHGIDALAVLGHKGAMDYVHAMRKHTDQYAPKVNAPLSVQMANSQPPLNPTAHHKYFTPETDHMVPGERADYAYHAALAANDVESIMSAAADRRMAHMPARVSLRTLKNVDRTRTRSLGTTTITAPPKDYNYDVSGLSTGDALKGSGQARNRKAPINLPDYNDNPYEWMDRDERELPPEGPLHSFAKTLAAKYDALEKPNPNIIRVPHDPNIVMHPTPRSVEHPDVEYIPPERKYDPELDDLNNHIYPKDLSGLSDTERRELRKTSLKGVVTAGSSQPSSVLKNRIHSAIKTQVRDMQDRLASWNMDTTPGEFKAVNAPDFKHKPYEPSRTPIIAPLDFHGISGYGSKAIGNGVHDILTGATRFSISNHRGPEDSATMIKILGPNQSVLRTQNYNDAIGHSAKIWKEVHDTVSSNPELHTDPRAHAALHFARMAHDYFADRGEHVEGSYNDANIATLYRDMGKVLNPAQEGVHADLAKLGSQYNKQASYFDNSTDISPKLNQFKRNVTAGLKKTARRVSRSEGAADVRDIINKITSHPLYQHISSRLSDAWKNVSEEERLDICNMLIEDQWPENWFGKWEPVDHFDAAVYHNESHKDGLQIPRRAELDSIDDLAHHPLAAKDKIAQQLISLGSNLPSARSSEVKKASAAIRSALHDRLDGLEAHHNLMIDVENDPRAISRVTTMPASVIDTEEKVIRLARAIRDHLTTSEYDRRDITHPALHAHVNAWLETTHGVAAAAEKVAKASAPFVKSVAKTAVSGIADMAHDAIAGSLSSIVGKRPDEKPFQPKSTVGRFATRVAIAASEAPGAALDFLSGPDVLAGPNSEKTLAKAKITRANIHRDKLTAAGLMMDPVDKLVDTETRKRANRLQTTAALRDIRDKKRARG